MMSRLVVHIQRQTVLAFLLLSLVVPSLLILGGCAPRLLLRSPRVTDEDQRQATQYFIQAKVFEAQGNHLGAIVALRSAADLDPTSATIYARLAYNYHHIDDLRLAVVYAELALDRDATQTELRYKLVAWYDGLGEAASAARHVEVLVEQDTHNWQLYAHLSRLYMDLGEHDKIDALYQRLARLSDTPVDVRVNIAYVISRSGRRQQAMEVFRAILAADPHVEDAWLGLGEALAADGQRLAARAAYGDGARLVPDSQLLIYDLARLVETPQDLAPILAREKPKYLYRLGTALSQLERFELATQVFEKIVGLRPTSEERWLDLVGYYLRRNDVTRAIAILEEASAALPASVNISLALASTLDGEGRDAEAGAIYAALVARGESSADLYIYLGVHHERAERWDAAIDAYRAGIVDVGDNPEIYIRWGIVLGRQQRWHEAADRFRKALAVDAQHAQAHLHLGVALQRLSQPEDAIEQLQRAVELDPTSTAALFYLGTALEQTVRESGDETHFDRAVATFEALVELSPQDAYALNYLGYMFAERGIRLQEAVELLQRAVAIDPDNGAFFDSLAWAYFRLGQLDQAESWIGKAMTQMQINVSNTSSADARGDAEEQAVIYNHAGDIAAALGKLDEAVDMWRRALELIPDDDDVRRKLQTP